MQTSQPIAIVMGSVMVRWLDAMPMAVRGNGSILSVSV